MAGRTRVHRYASGGRSFSICDTDGNRVFDSDHEETAFDNRSDNKGPEPEGLAVGNEVSGTTTLSQIAP